MKYKILILEDNSKRIEQFKLALKDHDVIYTDDALVAIKMLKKHKFDYIFLDHDLGGLENEWDEENCGMVVAKYISKHSISKESNVIVHSLNVSRAQEMVYLMENSRYVPFAWNLINIT
jgi:CheY-like chemotaxis protein